METATLERAGTMRPPHERLIAEHPDARYRAALDVIAQFDRLRDVSDAVGRKLICLPHFRNPLPFDCAVCAYVEYQNAAKAKQRTFRMTGGKR